MTEDGRPEVFISYSYDSEDHQNWVKAFADKLINDGIPTTVDIYDLHLGDKTPHFMEDSISKSDYVLIMITENYAKKANERTGGVGYETDIVTGEMITKSNKDKFIPILIKTDFSNVPEYLKGTFGINIKNLSSYDGEYTKLYRKLTQQEPQKPELGDIRIFDTDDKKKIFDIEEIRKQLNLDNWVIFDCILEINGLDISTPQLFRDIQENKISFCHPNMHIKKVPFVLDDYFKKSHNDGIIFERGNCAGASNRGMYEKCIIKNMVMRYSYIELTDNIDRYILIHLLNILRNLLHIFFILEIIEKKYDKKITISTKFSFDTNKETRYCVNWREFIEGNSLSTYMLQNLSHQDFEIKALDKNNIIIFLNRILESFIDTNQSASEPYMYIDETKYDDECNFLKTGDYYFEP